MYNNIIKSIKHWLNKSDGGEWFEPYVTNKDITIIILLTIIVSSIIIFGISISI